MNTLIAKSSSGLRDPAQLNAVKTNPSKGAGSLSAQSGRLPRRGRAGRCVAGGCAGVQPRGRVPDDRWPASASLALLGLPWSDRQERRYQRFDALCSLSHRQLAVGSVANAIALQTSSPRPAMPGADAVTTAILDAAAAEFEQHGFRRCGGRKKAVLTASTPITPRIQRSFFRSPAVTYSSAGTSVTNAGTA